MPRSDLYNAFGVNFGLIRSPRCAAARRPWAVEYNAFGVGPGRHANGIKTPDLGDNLRVHNSIAVSHRRAWPRLRTLNVPLLACKQCGGAIHGMSMRPSSMPTGVRAPALLASKQWHPKIKD